MQTRHTVAFLPPLASHRKNTQHGGVTDSYTGLLTVSRTRTLTQLLSFPKACMEALKEDFCNSVNDPQLKDALL